MAILTTALKHSRIITAICEEKSLPDPDNFTAKTTVIFQNQKRQRSGKILDERILDVRSQISEFLVFVSSDSVRGSDVV